MLRLPKPLLRARGTLTPPDDWPAGATLGSAWHLEAVYAGVPALTGDSPPPVASAGVLSLAAGVGDLCLAPGMDDLCPVAGPDDLSPTADAGGLRLAIGVGDLRPAPAGGGSTNDPDVRLASPSVAVTSSPLAPR